MQTNKQSSASLGEGKITEKAMEEMRARIGKPMRHLQRSVIVSKVALTRVALLATPTVGASGDISAECVTALALRTYNR